MTLLKVWDRQGRMLFSSRSISSPVSVLAWTAPGDAFVVGGSEKLLLCDGHGVRLFTLYLLSSLSAYQLILLPYQWKHDSVDLKGGSIYALDWSHDGRLLCAAMAGGVVFSGQTLDR